MQLCLWPICIETFALVKTGVNVLIKLTHSSFFFLLSLLLFSYQASADRPKIKLKKIGSQGQPCQSEKCDEGLTCVNFYGIGGLDGPTLNSCEIPCDANLSACPAGQSCMSIPDGPGPICQPTARQTNKRNKKTVR